MKMQGKILFFNEHEGTGLIITSTREKIKFDVQDWSDFDSMPTTGLEVLFNYKDNHAFDILSQENVDTQDALPEEEVVTPSQEVVEKSVSMDDEYDSDEDESAEDEEFREENELSEEHEHFEEEESISEIDEVEELLEEKRPESITNTLNLSTAISNYFNTIKQNIDKRMYYKKVDGRLDYLLIRRFLWTTYNNLTDIDIQIITPKIQTLNEDLRIMSRVYDDFMRKTKYPKLAYEEVFLSCQAEYLKIKDGAEKIVEKLNRLRIDENKIGGIREVRKKELEDTIQTEQFTLLEGELKSLNGAYVDVVHMMAELEERYKADLKLLHDFEQEYKYEFTELFLAEAKKHKFDLVDIINAQAFLFDMQLWHQAKKSKPVKQHFKKSSISGDLNTKTYLKYYLNTQDVTKSSGETQKLFDLYDYLVAVHKEYILIVVSDAQDAMEYEQSIKYVDQNYDVKSFVDEISAIRWAMKNSVKVLVVEEQLAKVRVEKFLDIYTRNVLSTPKIVLIGDKPKINTISISKLVAVGASARVIAQGVQSVL